MPFVFIIAGVVLLVAAVRNTVTTQGSQTGLIDLLKGDFTGSNNFTYWLIAIFVVGALGYVDSLKAFSRTFLTLIFIALVINVYNHNQQFFTQLIQQIGGSGSSNSASPSQSSNPVTNLQQAQQSQQQEIQSLNNLLQQEQNGYVLPPS